MKFKKVYAWLLILAVLTPLGLLASGSAWGEWAPEEVGQQVGFIPKGMKALGSLWPGFLPNYNVLGFSGRFLETVGYTISVLTGIALILLLFKLVAFVFPDEQKKDDAKNAS